MLPASLVGGGSCRPRPLTGVLIVDACADGGCDTIDFDEIRVFQMFDVGKTTKARVSIHADRGDVAPTWDDRGWDPVADWLQVGAGAYDPNPYHQPITVTDPAVQSFHPAVRSRYVRIEVQNNLGLGFGDYIQLRQVKLFGAGSVR